MSSMTLRMVLFCLVGMLVFPDLRAGLLDEVPKSNRDELASGQVVVLSEDVKDGPWPRLKLYQVVNAPPKVVADLFTDYASASDYTTWHASGKGNRDQSRWN